MTQRTMIQSTYDPTIEKHFKGHDNDITSLCFHPETTQLMSSSLDKTIISWNLETSVRAFRFIGHKDAVHEVTYSPSGEVIASASRDRSVRIWVPKVTGQCIDFKAHLGSVRSIQFSPNGEELLTASDDKSIKIWAVCQRKFLMSFLAHTNWIRCAKFSSDGRRIISCSDDKTIKLWDVLSGQCVKSFNDPKAYSTYVEFHPSDSVIGSSNIAGCVKLYDLRTNALSQYYAAHKSPVNMIKFHPKGNFMLTASGDSTMKVLDLLEGRPIYTLKGHATGTSVTSITFSSNGEFFASGGADRQLLMWKTNFDRDEIPCKIAQRLSSSTKHSKLSVEDGKSHKTDEVSENQQAKQSLDKKFHDLSIKDDGYRCETLDSNALEEIIEPTVIDTRTDRLPERNRMVDTPHLSKEPPCAQLSEQSMKIVDALNDQVQSLRAVMTALEQRLTVLEEELRK